MYAHERADDVLRMHRLARTGGTQALLSWAAGRAAGWAGLLDPDGTVLLGVSRSPGGHDGARTADGAHGAHGVHTAAPPLAASGARELTALGARSLSLSEGRHAVLVLPIHDPPHRSGPVLAVVAPRPLPEGFPALLTDLALPLATCWGAEHVERTRRRVELAESRGREAVLHLLMTGQLSVAHQVAGALKPPLPDPVQVCVVACPRGSRDEVARIAAELSGGRSWIVRCPVYARHLILIVPADPAAGGSGLGLQVAARSEGCAVGASEQVPLAHTATGYRQAFHALAVAREVPSRHAGFGAAPDPALMVGAAGARWADALLRPLLTHVPRRGQDPGSQELAATVTSWLAFSSYATAHLKIHRNTLAARVRFVGELLGLDLHRVRDQAALDLALRIRATPALPRPAPARSGPEEGEAGGTLDAILGDPAVRAWAAQVLRPVTAPGTPAGGGDPVATLGTWLDCEAQLAPTATALGISVPGARKRLTRLESVLRRSLLRSPSARYDLWLAFRALALEGGAGPETESGAYPA